MASASSSGAQSMKVKVQHLWGALVKERAVLRRLVAKTRNQHRCTPHFLALTRLLSCVSAIRSLKPNLLLDEAATLVAQPQRNQQQILWRALQIQHFCALCAQVIQQCERCFRQFTTQLAHGYFMAFALTVTSSTARMFTCTLVALRAAVVVHGQLAAVLTTGASAATLAPSVLQVLQDTDATASGQAIDIEKGAASASTQKKKKKQRSAGNAGGGGGGDEMGAKVNRAALERSLALHRHDVKPVATATVSSPGDKGQSAGGGSEPEATPAAATEEGDYGSVSSTAPEGSRQQEAVVLHPQQPSPGPSVGGGASVVPAKRAVASAGAGAGAGAGASASAGASTTDASKSSSSKSNSKSSKGGGKKAPLLASMDDIFGLLGPTGSSKKKKGKKGKRRKRGVAGEADSSSASAVKRSRR